MRSGGCTASSRWSADRIRERLSERYALVGYTEAFDEFVYLLHEIEGLPLCRYANRLVRSERESYVPPASDLDAVGQSHIADALLHEIVKAEFQSRIDALSADSRHRLQQFLASLRAHRAESKE